jgi:hypothetical protein
MASTTDIHRFLEPLSIDVDRSYELSRKFLANFRDLAANSRDQWLPTPISESILRHLSDQGTGQ